MSYTVGFPHPPAVANSLATARRPHRKTGVMDTPKHELARLWANLKEYAREARRSARHRGIAWKLTDEQLWEKWVVQEGKCALTGEPLCLTSRKERKKGFPRTASLDRVDSRGDYCPENVRWVTKQTNMARGTMPDEAFLKVCRAVSSFPENVCFTEEEKRGF